MSFARHETFYLREGWLFKGMRAIQGTEKQLDSSTIFLDKEAPERLGIGRNMVNALRFWMQATGLAEEQFNGRAFQRLTPFGQCVWEFDPYLEHELTLWLIHYHLLSQREYATTWYWFFNHYSPTSFDEQTTLDALTQWVTTTETERIVSIGSLKKDVNCLLQTYLPDDKKRSPEDMRQSPLAQLGIFGRSTGNPKQYYWQRVDLMRLHPLAVLYVLLDSQAKSVRGSNEVRLRDLLYEPMNVGRVFNITTAGLTEIIHLLQRDYNYEIDFVRTGQLDQIKLPTNENALSVLKEYYIREKNS